MSPAPSSTENGTMNLFEDKTLTLGVLEVKNVKGARAVTLKFDPEQNLFVIGGENEAGKSSTIDALWYLIAGAKNIPEMPIRQGEKRASVEAVLNDKATGKPHLKAVRTWWYDKRGALKTKLELSDPEGVPIPGGAQGILDRLYSHLLDPVEFLNMDHRKKVEAVRECVGIDFSELDAKRDKAYAKRTAANANRDALDKRYHASEFYPEAEGKEVPDVSDLVAKAKEADALAAKRDKLKEEADRIVETNEGFQRRVDDLLAEIERLRSNLEATQEQIAKNNERQVDVLKEADAIEVPEVGDVSERIKEAEALREKVRANQAYHALKEEFEAAERAWRDLDDEVKEIDAEKERRLSEAKFPLEGMGFDKDHVTYNGKPLHQCSTSEQIRVSVAMALVNPPKLPIIFIRRSESLDAKRLKLIADFARDRGALVIAERVSTGPECSVVIEEGYGSNVETPKPKSKEEQDADKQAKREAGVYDL